MIKKTPLKPRDLGRVQNFLSMELMKEYEKQCVVKRTLNSSTQDAEARGPGTQGQPELHSEFKDSVGYALWPCLKTQKQTNKTVIKKINLAGSCSKTEGGKKPTEDGWEREARRGLHSYLGKPRGDKVLDVLSPSDRKAKADADREVNTRHHFGCQLWGDSWIPWALEQLQV